MSQPKTVAAIPCYNEERHIGDIVNKAKEYVDQVIVVDDGSIDKTGEVAEARGAMVLRHKVNKGRSMAINTAFKWAKENKVQAVVLLDGDGQHEPMDIPLVLRPVVEGKVDVVVGSRFLSTKNRIPRYRTVGQHVLTFVTNLSSGLKLTDCQSGFRAFSGRAVDALYFTYPRPGDVECEMQFLMKENYLKVEEVPITVNYDDRPKRNSVIQGVGNLFAVLRLALERRPIVRRLQKKVVCHKER